MNVLRVATKHPSLSSHAILSCTCSSEGCLRIASRTSRRFQHPGSSYSAPCSSDRVSRRGKDEIHAASWCGATEPVRCKLRKFDRGISLASLGGHDGSFPWSSPSSSASEVMRRSCGERWHLRRSAVRKASRSCAGEGSSQSFSKSSVCHLRERRRLKSRAWRFGGRGEPRSVVARRVEKMSLSVCAPAALMQACLRLDCAGVAYG